MSGPAEMHAYVCVCAEPYQYTNIDTNTQFHFEYIHICLFICKSREKKLGVLQIFIHFFLFCLILFFFLFLSFYFIVIHFYLNVSIQKKKKNFLNLIFLCSSCLLKSIEMKKKKKFHIRSNSYSQFENSAIDNHGFCVYVRVCLRFDSTTDLFFVFQLL